MKKLFLASSFADVSRHFPAFWGQDIAGKTVTFIPTASVVEKMTFYVKADRKALESLGFTIDELDVSQADPQAIQTKLSQNDLIYVSGGNTFYLLQALKQSGADQLIADLIAQGKPYIGASAGTMVLAPSIDYVQAMDSCKKAPGLTDYQALGIVDFYPLPHYGEFPFKKAC